ncbi:unnamed protein product [Choristocarpus tenellus]
MSDHDDEEEGYSDWAEVPKNLKGLRACKRCSLVKSNDQASLQIYQLQCFRSIDYQFVNTGCENCDFLEMESDQTRVQECTTTYFSGLMSMIEPDSSWVAKWQRINGCRPGMYAIEVIGELPRDALELMEEKGIPYQCKSA